MPPRPGRLSIKHSLRRLVSRVPPDEYVTRQRRLHQGGVAANRRSGNPAGGQTAGPSSRSIRPNHRQASHFLGFGDRDLRPADQGVSHAGRVVMREARDGRSASSSLSAPPLKHQQPAWMGATRRSASRRQRRRQLTEVLTISAPSITLSPRTSMRTGPFA